jgi:hypothetical protein
MKLTDYLGQQDNFDNGRTEHPGPAHSAVGRVKRALLRFGGPGRAQLPGNWDQGGHAAAIPDRPPIANEFLTSQSLQPITKQIHSRRRRSTRSCNRNGLASSRNALAWPRNRGF